jgi:hypothetical protein
VPVKVTKKGEPNKQWKQASNIDVYFNPTVNCCMESYRLFTNKEYKGKLYKTTFILKKHSNKRRPTMLGTNMRLTKDASKEENGTQERHHHRHQTNRAWISPEPLLFSIEFKDSNEEHFTVIFLDM